MFINFTTEEAGDPNAPSQQIFSVDNPTFRELDTSNQVNSNPAANIERFDNPIYAQAKHPMSTDGHYSRLDSRMGMGNGKSILAPASSSVVDLLNSIADYSTLDDSMRTQSTVVSNARDHQYEQIDGEELSPKNNTLQSSLGEDNEHEYSRLGQSIPGKPASSHEYDLAETVENPTESEGTGLPHPYENLDDSGTSSPDIGAAVKSSSKKYDHLVLMSDDKAIISGDTSTPMSPHCVSDVSDTHEYDCVENGVYANTDLDVSKEDSTKVEQPQEPVINLYDDAL